MVIHNFQDLCLLQARHRLCPLIVIHQHNPLAPGTQQVEAGQHPHHPLILVQNGVGTEAALQHPVLHIVDIVAQMKIDQVVVFTDMADRHGVADQPHHLIGVKWSRNHTGIRLLLQQFLLHLRLADDDAADIHLDGPANHIRLLAADHNALRMRKHQVLPVRRQSNGHRTRDGVFDLAAAVEHMALQHREKIVHWNILNHRVPN